MVRVGASAPSLARRLGELAGDERQVQVEFPLRLDGFDRRQTYLDLGFGSLWEYCRAALHLREGAASRRIGAMRVLRRHRWRRFARGAGSAGEAQPTG